MAFENTNKVLQRYAEALASLYKQQLADEGVDASFRIANSIQTKVIIGDETIFIEMYLEDYWYYIDEGRQAGSFPPVDSIINWIRVKPVIPQPTILPAGSQVIPTENQLAYLIGRKISNEGIEGKHLLSMSNEQIFSLFENDIQEALTLDLTDEIITTIRVLV